MTRIRRMTTDDVELVRALIPLWRAERQWAERLLCEVFELSDASEILAGDLQGKHRIPGSNWFYQTHGIGVDIDRGGSTGGIDFDFDKPDPDPYRLRVFAIKQRNAGNISNSTYRHLIEDVDRFEEAAQQAILIESE